MTFISYAQNYEDLVLWRTLKDVGAGFYVDVGAQDPVVDSVTLAFYERGWRGINIEPVPRWFDRLQGERPRDINLQLAAGEHEGTMLLHEVEQTGLSTADGETAQRHAREKGYRLSERVVVVKPLRDVLAEHAPPQVHFLKVDVEGMEYQVLAGNDWERFRPWIVVVESTIPNSRVENYASWEPILTSARYAFVYADGLNRFYLAGEHGDLTPGFRYPPNLFDNFKVASARQAELRASNAEAARRSLEAEIDDMRRTLSWRITAPFRRIQRTRAVAWFRQLGRFPLQLSRHRIAGRAAIGSARLAVRRLISRIAQRLVAAIRSSPRLKRLARPVKSRFPRLAFRLVGIASGQPPAIPDPQQPLRDIASLTPLGQRVWRDLMQERERALESSEDRVPRLSEERDAPPV